MDDRRNNITDKLKLFLSDKKVSFAIIGLAIGSRVLQLIYFYTIGFDASYQVIGTHSFVSGHWVSIPIALPADLSATIYEPLINWPPGYSVLLSPFYVLFNHNYVAAGLALDILAAIALILVSRRILKLLGSSKNFINIFTLLTSFFIYPFYFVACSDAIAITSFIIAIYYCLLLLKTDGGWIKNTIAMIVFLFLSGSIKYLFIPVALIIPVFLFLKGRVDHRTLLKKSGIFSFVVLGVILGGLLAYQKYITGTATYISEPGRGFFPEHLVSAFPFLPGSFIKPETISVLFDQQRSLTGSIYRGLQFIHILVFIFFIGYAFKMFFRRGIKNISLQGSYFWLVFIVSITITVLLAILSLRVPKEEIMPGYLWTYIQEPRYYGLVIVLLQLSVMVFYELNRQKASKYLKYAFYFILLLLIPELFRGIVFTGNRILKLGKETYTWQLEHRFQQDAERIIQEARQKHGVEDVIVTGGSLYISNRVSVYSHIPVLQYGDQENDISTLQTRKKVLLLIILFEKELPTASAILSLPGIEKAGDSPGFYFYVYPISPR